ncbi:octaprenyl diphosphate synthase [Candidatus Palibaumannia cicadellinicola]|uniref:Octaprenyl diphosphate synthase n=1 Tax=Candidatus Palibaumannia cicadellinicola TaxID=186490 RepID=A0A0K2BLF7_9GAMM|nr:octaprenyl diphosphate synthase [Candidatus Baumannia cicadellinicola]AKZ66165.1 Octaprenyl diphosphate synthase [Candidatus Baumannia cicadellinicola]
MNFEKINELIALEMANVNAAINDQLYSEIILIKQLVNYIISCGGKRIRPMIVLLTALALNYKGNQHVTVAALIEFIHTATLLHDDVVDKSNMRRGKTSANIIFGNAASILVGDFIYTRAFQMIIALNSLRVLKLMSEAVNVIVEGEIIQLINCRDPNITTESYMRVIYSKTARLFEVASQSSAVLAGALPDQEIELRNYGRYLGTAFQLIDDVLDYSNNCNILGKNYGNDLNEGKPTLPLLHAMRNGTPIQSSFIRQVIMQQVNSSKLNVNVMDKVLETMQQCGSLEYTRQCAEEEVDKAITCLTCLSPSPYRDALESLAKLVVTRNV